MKIKKLAIQQLQFTTVELEGWTVLFHPDLIRRHTLGKNIDQYSFFDYDLNEALHVSDQEKQSLTSLVHQIEKEIEQNMDRHSQKLIVSNLELLIAYCARYYDRQFYTRSNQNHEIGQRFDQVLKEFFEAQEQLESGLPTVKYCAKHLNISPSYLSDILKKETGKGAQEYIHGFIIEKAKTLLLRSNDTISEIAFGLGFEYSQHFSKLFKQKTGMSPKEYRIVN